MKKGGVWGRAPRPGPVYEHLRQPRQLTNHAEHELSTARGVISKMVI
jgi:hypothetical protein